MKCPQEISPIAEPGSDFMRSQEPSAPARAAQPGARQGRLAIQGVQRLMTGTDEE